MSSDAQLEIQTVQIAALRPDENNARRHTSRNLEAIAGSLRRFGQQRPVVVSQDNVVVAGNGTVAAAKELGWTEIQAVILPFTDPERIKAYAIADNRSADLAEWDYEELAAQLGSMGALNAEAAGFSWEELDDVIAGIQGGGLASVPADPDLEDFYLSRITRAMVLSYPNHVYVWAIAQLKAIREQDGYESNAAAVAALIQGASHDPS